MTSPFRQSQPAATEDLVGLFRAVEALREEDQLSAALSRSVAEHLDRAVFDLIGETTTPTPFTADATLPDPRKRGSQLQQVEQEYDDALAAVLAVLEEPTRYPVSAR